MSILKKVRKLRYNIGQQLLTPKNRDYLTGFQIRTRNDLRRIGTEYGGWVIPTSLLSENSICYCVGCGEDISFDLGLIDAFKVSVFAFDPTPRSIEFVKKHTKGLSKYHFKPLGLWSQNDTLRFYVPKNPKHVSHSLVNLQKTNKYIEVPVERLRDVMANNGHNHIDLLKLDIEGAEYKVIDTILEDELDIHILCIEYDEAGTQIDGDYKIRIRQSVSNIINAGYELVCVQSAGNYTFIKSGIVS